MRLSREHEEITSQFVPRSDLILFVTSADRPYTESERIFLEKIRAWGKKIVLVINKIDILENPEALDRDPGICGRKCQKDTKIIPGDLPGQLSASA